MLRYRDLRFRTSIPWRRTGEGMFVIAKEVFDERGNVIAGRTGEWTGEMRAYWRCCIYRFLTCIAGLRWP